MSHADDLKEEQMKRIRKGVKAIAGVAEGFKKYADKALADSEAEGWDFSTFLAGVEGQAVGVGQAVKGITKNL